MKIDVLTMHFIHKQNILQVNMDENKKQNKITTTMNCNVITVIIYSSVIRKYCYGFIFPHKFQCSRIEKKKRESQNATASTLSSYCNGLCTYICSGIVRILCKFINLNQNCKFKIESKSHFNIESNILNDFQLISFCSVSVDQIFEIDSENWTIFELTINFKSKQKFYLSAKSLISLELENQFVYLNVILKRQTVWWCDACRSDDFWWSCYNFHTHSHTHTQAAWNSK